MTWEGSDRRSRLPADWAERVRLVKHRAGGVCEQIRSSGKRCTNPGRDVDHVVPESLGGSDDLANLELLCLWHHRAKSAAEGHAAAAASRAKAKRPTRRHPGLT